MALAESQHHTSRGQKTARAGGGVRDAVHGQVPEALLPQEPSTQHFSLDDDDSVPELWGSRSTVRPQERVQRHAVEQIGDSAPFLPLMGEQLVVVYKLLDVMVPEQVIAVPKIFVGDIPPRRLCREPQMVDQLVTVPTNPDIVLCVFTRSPVSPMEDQLVEVPPIVPQPVPFFAGADGYVWRQLSGPKGAYWWRVGSSHTQWAPPVDVPVYMQHKFQQSLVLRSVHQQSGGYSSCYTETGMHNPQLQFLDLVVVPVRATTSGTDSAENSGIAAGAAPVVLWTSL